jgi:hypothetical protein
LVSIHRRSTARRLKRSCPTGHSRGDVRAKSDFDVSQLKGTTMKMLKTITFAASLALAAPLVAPTPAAAQTACAHWDVTQRWVAVQGNTHVHFDLRQERTTVAGTAGYIQYATSFVSQLFAAAGRTQYVAAHAGNATGTINGNSIELATSWGGVYVGRIDPTGRIDGVTYDKRDSTSSATWYSDRRMNCRSTTAVPSWQSSAHLPRPEYMPPRQLSDRTTDLLVAPTGWTPGPTEDAPKGIKGQQGPASAIGAVRVIRAVTPAAPPSLAAVPVPSAACRSGYVWRVARPSDLVCVELESRTRVAEENRTAAARVQPDGGAYGPNTCRVGYVWREAFAGDLVCVTPEVRALVAEENRLGPGRRAQ